MIFGTWNVKSLHMAGSLKTGASKLATHKVIQEVRYLEDGNQPVHDYTFFYGNGNANHHLGTGFFTYKRIIPVIKREEFISDRMFIR
jgi:hypothetical protein